MRTYANFLSIEKGDHEKAEHFNVKGLKIMPNDHFLLLNYGSCLLLQDGKEQRGFRILLDMLNDKKIRECLFIKTAIWILIFIHSKNKEIYNKALSEVKRNMIQNDARINGETTCNFNRNIEKSFQNTINHKAFAKDIMAVFVSNKQCEILNRWETWKEIKLNKESEDTIINETKNLIYKYIL